MKKLGWSATVVTILTGVLGAFNWDVVAGSFIPAAEAQASKALEERLSPRIKRLEDKDDALVDWKIQMTREVSENTSAVKNLTSSINRLDESYERRHGELKTLILNRLNSGN